MSIAAKFPDLTPEEISMQLIVRAGGEGGYDPAGFFVETPAGKAVRP